jgi:hypothetical protein
MSAPLSRWAVARTVIAASGLGFAAVALGGACLDYAGESWGTCGTPAAGSGAAKAGSGSGTGAPSSSNAADCGADAEPRPVATGGSGSAAPR